MGYIKYYLLLVVLFNLPDMYGQLNEFMISSYHYEGENPGRNRMIFFTELKNKYNFNTIYFSFPSVNYLYDDMYKDVKESGLKTILTTHYLHSRYGSYNKDAAESELRKYSTSAYNVIGYNFIDEPPIDELNNIPQYSELVRNYNDRLLRFVTFYPSTAYTDDVYREEYMQKHINISKPNLLAFDHYPIFWPSYDYFISLYDHALKSVENSIPFIYIVTPLLCNEAYEDTNPNNIYYPKTLNQFRYVIFAALSYGAKGISYWPGFEWAYSKAGMRLLDYEPGVKEQLSALHRKLIDNSDELLSLNFTSAYHKSNKSTIDSTGVKFESIHPFCGWDHFLTDGFAQKVFYHLSTSIIEVLTGNIPEELAITFHTNKSEKVYFWLFNKSLNRELDLKLNLIYSIEDIFNGDIVDDQETVHLLPGEAKLFKLALRTHMHK